MHISQDLILSFLKLLLFYADLLHKAILRVLWVQKLELRKSTFFPSWHIISSGACPAAYTDKQNSFKAEKPTILFAFHVLSIRYS